MELTRWFGRRGATRRGGPPSTAVIDRRTNFADDAINRELADHGYAVLPQQLEASAVDRLAALYGGVVDEVGRDTTGRFLPSMMIGQPHLRSRLWDGVRDIVSPCLGPVFVPGSTEVLGGSFVSKPASEHSVRNPHQDPSVFDERRHVSISIWIPLTDSHRSNGTLYVLPGSHRMGNHVRPPDVANFDDEVNEVALRESVPIELDAGQLLVIDGAVIHHSPPNESGEERVAAICAVRPAGATMSLMRSEGGADVGNADLYEVDVEVFRSGDLIHPDLDPASLLARVPYRPATLDDLARSRRAS